MLVEPSHAGQSGAANSRKPIQDGRARAKCGITSRANNRIDCSASARLIIPKFTCSDAEFEATDLTVVALDGIADIVGRADPGGALFDLALEGFLEIDWIIFW